ncbi:hypothetical protein LINPERHAP2_LOCUS6097 [Linum perenne]
MVGHSEPSISFGVETGKSLFPIFSARATESRICLPTTDALLISAFMSIVLTSQGG